MFNLEENKDNEQYFYNEATINELLTISRHFHSICCLCTPTLGLSIEKLGLRVKILDIDQRFALSSNYSYFDINNPQWMGDSYDLIVCDPPFFTTSPAQLRKTIDMLSKYNYNQNLLISYLRRRKNVLINAFYEYKIRSTDIFANYISINPVEKNLIEFFGNIDLQGMY